MSSAVILEHLDSSIYPTYLASWGWQLSELHSLVSISRSIFANCRDLARSSYPSSLGPALHRLPVTEAYKLLQARRAGIRSSCSAGGRIGAEEAVAWPENLRTRHEPNIHIKPQTQGPAILRRMKDLEDLASGPLDPQALSTESEL